MPGAGEILLRLRLAGQQQTKQGIDSVAASVDHLGDEAAQAARQQREASATTAQLGDSSQKSSSKVRQLAKRAVQLGAGLAAIHQAKKAVDTTEELGKSTIVLSRAFGMDTQVAANWASVAKVRGIETSKLSMGLTTLSKGVRANAKEFKTLGVSQEILKRGNVQEILEKTSDGLAKMPAGAQKAAVMSKLFGRSWQSIRPILDGGSGAMKEQLALAQKYVPDLAASKGGVEELAKAQREAKFATMGLQVTFGKLFIPVLTKVSKLVARSVGFFREHKSAAQALKVVMIVLATAFAANKILAWTQALKSSLLATKAMKAAQIALNIVMRMNPIMLAVTAIAALAAGLVFAYKKSATFRNFINMLWNAIKTGFGWVKKNWPTLLAILTGPIGLAVLAVVKNFGKIKSAARSVWNGIKSIFSGGAKILGSIFKAPINAAISLLKKVKIDIPKIKAPVVGTVFPGLKLDPFAGLNTLDTGGRVIGGGQVVVGGSGPEILTLSQGDRVTSPRKANIRRDPDPFGGGLIPRRGTRTGQLVLNLHVGARQFARAVIEAQELERALA